jgi:hypothetical protein
MKYGVDQQIVIPPAAQQRSQLREMVRATDQLAALVRTLRCSALRGYEVVRVAPMLRW